MAERERGSSGLAVRLLETLVVVAGLLQLVRSPRRPSLPPGVDAEDLAVGYEASDADVRWIVVGALALLLALVVALVAVSNLQAWLTRTSITVARPDELIAGLAAGPTPAPPRLEAQSGQDAAAYRARVDQQLHTYRWVDRNSGVVAIPIDRAMDLMTGASAGTSAGATPVATPAVAQPSRSSSGRMEVGQWP